MYINDVIKRVKAYYPSEYSLTEMYEWCDEVSAMLAIEDRRVYCEAQCAVASDGTILLPEGVNIEYIDRVIKGDTVLWRNDVRTSGKKYINIKGQPTKVMYNGERASPGESVTVIYIKPYVPIRLASYEGPARIDTNESSISIPKCEFIPCDIITIKDENDVTVRDVGIFDVQLTNDEEYPYKLICSGGVLYPLEGMTNGTYKIMRYVTDKTICDAPFDMMYVDYVLAQINKYQRDISSYNQYMSSFNTRLDAYRKWLAQRMPTDEAKFTNYW